MDQLPALAAPVREQHQGSPVRARVRGAAVEGELGRPPARGTQQARWRGCADQAGMRTAFAPVLLHLAVLFAGLGLLRVGGVVPRLLSVRALAAGGLAYLCGLAAVLTLSILLLVLGGPFNLATFVVICMLLASPLILDLRAAGRTRLVRPLWLANPRAYWREARPEQRLALASMFAFGLLGVVGLLTLSGQPIARE